MFPLRLHAGSINVGLKFSLFAFFALQMEFIWMPGKHTAAKLRGGWNVFKGDDKVVGGKTQCGEHGVGGGNMGLEGGLGGLEGGNGEERGAWVCVELAGSV